MAAPIWLDPRTLRWLADEAEREAQLDVMRAEDCERMHREKVAAGSPQSQTDWLQEAAKTDRSRAHVGRRRAMWLRSTATRVERRRARGER